MTRGHALALVVALAVLLSFFRVGAAPSESTAKQRARVHYKNGQTLQASGDFAGALKEYEIAYQLFPVPEFVFNMAQVNRLAGNKQAALQSYRQFVSLSKNERANEEAQRWIAKLSAEVGEGKAVPDAAAPQPVADLGADAAEPDGGTFTYVPPPEPVPGPPRLAGAHNQAGSIDAMAGVARFNGPAGVVVDHSGNAYVADAGNGVIRKIALDARAVSTVASIGGAPLALAFDEDTLYVADPKSATVRKVTLSTGMVTTVAGTDGQTGNSDGTGAAARFSAPMGLALDGTGALYVSDAGENHTLRKIVLGTQQVSTLAGKPGAAGAEDGVGAAARFSSPRGLAIYRGDLFVADAGTNSIRKVALATGAVTTLAGATGVSGSADGVGASARFLEPEGIAVDSDGIVYVADTGNNALRKIAGGRRVSTLLKWGSSTGPVGLAMVGNDLLVTHQDHTLFRVRAK